MSVIDTESPEFEKLVNDIVDKRMKEQYKEEFVPLMIKTVNDRVDAKSHDTERHIDRRLAVFKKNMGERFHRISKILQEG